MDSIDLRRLHALDDDIPAMAAEADCEGHRFVRRLIDDWLAGTNRFDRPGELLLGAYRNDRLMAVGGLNRDPYTRDDGVGRLRHLYVRADGRRLGIGRILVQRIITEAAGTFAVLRLRTMTADAAAFYERLGFDRTDEDAATHVIRLP